MILGAHQNNLFVYAGVLERLSKCDLFVLLNNVQFTRGNYHNRFCMNDRWYTLSMNQSLEPLAAKRYIRPKEDWATIKRRIPMYEGVLGEFDDLLAQNMCDTNEAILRRVCEKLGITTKIVTDYPTKLKSTARLVDLCTHFGADEYLSGPSGADYMDEEIFHAADVGVRYQLPTPDRRAAIEVLKEGAL